jgi:hypothetical protein
MNAPVKRAQGEMLAAFLTPKDKQKRKDLGDNNYEATLLEGWF